MPINQNMDIEISTRFKTAVVDGKEVIQFIDEIVIDRYNFEQRIKILTMIRKTTLGEVSKKFGVTQASFFSRCRRGKMSFEEQRKIAEIFDCDVVIKFVFDDGKEFEADTIRELVANSCKYVGITQAELGERLGKSRQTFSIRLIKGRFTAKEIAEIAEKIGCKYVNYFELNDETRI